MPRISNDLNMARQRALEFYNKNPDWQATDLSGPMKQIIGYLALEGKVQVRADGYVRATMPDGSPVTAPRTIDVVAKVSNGFRIDLPAKEKKPADTGTNGTPEGASADPDTGVIVTGAAPPAPATDTSGADRNRIPASTRRNANNNRTTATVRT